MNRQLPIVRVVIACNVWLIIVLDDTGLLFQMFLGRRAQNVDSTVEATEDGGERCHHCNAASNILVILLFVITDCPFTVRSVLFLIGRIISNLRIGIRSKRTIAQVCHKQQHYNE
jgi:hypothetical protein